jgi:HEPN domain-containing protein
MDVQKQIDYWRDGSEDNLAGARVPVENGHFEFGLFAAHLALEKMLKAHVTKATNQLPPKIHNLARLGAMAGLAFPPERKRFLNRFDIYQIEGRYPDDIRITRLGRKDAEQLLAAAEEMITWLIAQL